MTMGDLEIGGEILLADRIAMVLGRDEDAATAEILHGLVSPAMPELQLERRGPEGQGEDLVPETDPEDRLLL